MSRRTNRLADSDIDDRCCPSRHCYNTRSSAHLRTGNSPARSYKRAHRYTKNYEDDKESSSMDYCFDPTPCEPPKKRWSSWLGSFIYYLSLGTVIYLAYTQFLVTQDIKDLKEELRKTRGVKKSPHAKPSKELDKKCSEALKIILKDPVNRPDFALESSGGRVVHVEAVPFSDPVTLLGIVLCDGRHSPSMMIQATTSPGQCWAFKGHTAKAIVELIDDVMVDAVTLEHIPPTISPSGKIDTAPKDFKIWGLDPHGGRALLGQFRYENDSTTVQTFTINNESSYFRLIEFEVLSNHGNEGFTCVYRLRVHGTPQKSL